MSWIFNCGLKSKNKKYGSEIRNPQSAIRNREAAPICGRKACPPIKKHIRPMPVKKE